MTFDPSKVKDKLAGMHQRDASGKLHPREHAIQLDPKKVSATKPLPSPFQLLSDCVDNKTLIITRFLKIEVQYGGAGLFANSAEYCQILVALLNKGTHPKTKGQILKPETVELLFTPQLKGDMIKDLDTPFEPPMPEFSNPFTMLEGVPKNWCFGGAMTPEGMPNGRGKDVSSSGCLPFSTNTDAKLSPCDTRQSFWWAGIANHYYFVDRSDNTCGMIQAQVFPFFDLKIVAPFFFEFEPMIHEEIKSKSS